MPENPRERRAEPRRIIDQYHSVEFSIRECAYLYQFKIWDMSTKGLCVLVKEDSDLLKHLKVGEILDLKYYTTDPSIPAVHLKTEIKHITKDDEGRFRGLYLVGLSILEGQNPNKRKA
jgi:hypothetical protein